MIIKALTIAAAAGLVSTAAFARDDSATSPNTVNPVTQDQALPAGHPPIDSTLSSTPTEQSTVRAATGSSSDVVAVSPDQARAQGIPVETVASAPVPDTQANRAKYGGPMSMTGKRTAARGN